MRKNRHYERRKVIPKISLQIVRKTLDFRGNFCENSRKIALALASQ